MPLICDSKTTHEYQWHWYGFHIFSTGWKKWHSIEIPADTRSYLWNTQCFIKCHRVFQRYERESAGISI